MTYLETLIDNVQDWLEDSGDETAVIRAINRAIRRVEKIKDWEALKDYTTLTPTAAGVIINPARCRVIRRMYPATYVGIPDYRFVGLAELTEANRPRTTNYKYTADPAVTTQLSSGLLLDITQNNTIVTESATSGDVIDVTWVGEQVSLEGDETLYEVVSAIAGTSMVLTPDVRSATQATTSAKVRPIGLTQYKLTDADGTAFTNDVYIAYQAKHPQLINYKDQLLLPCEDMVTLTAVQFFLHQTKYDVDARALQIAYKQAEKVETQQEATASPEAVSPRASFGVRSRRSNGTLR